MQKQLDPAPEPWADTSTIGILHDPVAPDDLRPASCDLPIYMLRRA